MTRMNLRTVGVLAVVLGLCLLAPAAPAKERSEVAAKYKWNLADLYPSPDAWQQAKQDLVGRLPLLESHRGHVGASAESLYRAITDQMDFSRDYGRLYTYASQLSDEDARESKPREMLEEAEQLGVRFGSAVSWLDPEILAVGQAKIESFTKSDARFKPYRVYLDNVLRYAPHTLDADGEKIVAEAGRMAGAGGNLRSVFDNAELPWPTISVPDGKKVKKVRLDNAAYTEYRASASRAVRDTVFRAFFRAHRKFQGTYGTALSAAMQAHVFERNVRKFDSCLESSLFGNNIPTSVYTQLVSDVNKNLPTLHRYLKLRQRMMGVKQLRYEDLYAPLVHSVDLRYTPEQAQDIVLAAVKPLGQAYVDTLRWGFTHGWVDWLPTTGKRSGAYSTGAYGVHPYQLQNFTGLYDEVSTVAHESGHSMHTFLADQAQPYATHDYATFVAEVASTLNENLLLHYMLDRTKDTPTRLFLLGNYLEGLRGTLFRQTMFAEFELAIHEKAEKGEALSGEALTDLYLGIVRRYYGHDQGVCKVDELYGVEWSYIPHFYYNFYVYQYATSIVASSSLAANMRADGTGTAARDRYLTLLKSGSSKYPIDLLKDAGVDMTTSEPFNAAMKEMNAVMDEIEKLLATK
jgi:oligoendopeptidase F